MPAEARTTGVQLTRLGLAHARVQVASNIHDLDIRSHGPHLGDATQTRRPHASAAWQGVKRVACAAHDRVTRIHSLGHGRDHQPARQLRGHVLHGMHAQIDRTCQKLHLELFREQALPAHLRKWNVQNTIAGGLDHFDLGRKPSGGLDEAFHILGLP